MEVATQLQDELTPDVDPGDALAPGLHAIGLLGDGKRFETWLAWSTTLWAPVAVKLVQPGQADERTCAALAHEAATVSTLVHPGTQRLIENHADSRPPYLVYEYVEGPTLADLLDEEGALAPGDVVRLGLQLAGVLRYLHGRGVVHLDLKPANIALRDGRAIVLDFDIARPVGARGSGRKPRGSPPFMAPEQVRCEPAAPSMDLFALGAVLYEAATDAPAFAPLGEGAERDYPQLHGRPVPPDTLAPELPRAVSAAIERLLEPDPRARPSSADEALRLLAAVLRPGEEGLWPDWATGLLPTPSPRYAARG